MFKIEPVFEFSSKIDVFTLVFSMQDIERRSNRYILTEQAPLRHYYVVLAS